VTRSVTRRPVVAIGLDAADHALVEKWCAAGHLPNLQRLRERGSRCSLHHIDFYSDETPWTNFLTGSTPCTTEFWGPFEFSPETYRVKADPYAFDAHLPFYAHAGDRSVCVFDVPHCPRLFDAVKGVQVLGWGAHAAMGPMQSSPPELVGELVERYGRHTGLAIEYAGSWLQPDYLERLRSALLESIERKTRICLDLLDRQEWDLFLAVFSEPHFALHKFWHLSDPGHPLHALTATADRDPLRDVYCALDSMIGSIAERIPEEADLLVFSVHGSEGNVADLHSLVYLPELLHRYSFGGRGYLCRAQDPGAPLPPVRTSTERDDWLRAVWNQTATSKTSLVTMRQWPAATRLLPRVLGKLWWQPLLWMRHRWPRMKAFALPTFGDGYVRINLAGRERRGLVPESEYESVCDEISEMLTALRNPRNGEPVVKEVVRTRSDPRARGPRPPDADLVVVWGQPPADMVESPTLGRLGPLPFRETGGHRPEGFLIACGDGIAAGRELERREVVDLAPSLLSRMGLSPPPEMEGKSFLE